MWRIEVWEGSRKGGSWRFIAKESDFEKVQDLLKESGGKRLTRARNPDARPGEYHLMQASPIASYKVRLL